MIDVRHLSHTFGPHWALKDCTFSLEKGDFVFLCGPSGAGKSTLLRILYAGLPVQRGEVNVAGMDLKSLPGARRAQLRRQVGVVFQDFKILSGRTVLQNIALPLEVRGLARQNIERRVRAVSRALGLEGRLDLKCGELSGGEQQRVAIARAFVVNPQVLLADEPTGNLDQELSFRLMELFKQFQSYGATVLFATHSAELMRRHPGAYVMRIENGMITEANWPGARIFCAPDASAVDRAAGLNTGRTGAGRAAHAARQASEQNIGQTAGQAIGQVIGQTGGQTPGHGGQAAGRDIYQDARRTAGRDAEPHRTGLDGGRRR